MSAAGFDAALLAAFFAASFVLAATPGPGVVYIVTRTLAQGRRAGLASVAGVALGNLGNAIGASIGLAALLQLSALAFTAVQWAGAAYLVWLGVSALRTGDTPHPAAAAASERVRRLFRDGLVVALLNPKTALFFAAFLPQFMSAAWSPFVQSVAFGAAFVLIAACTDCAWVFAADRVAPALSNLAGARRHGRVAGGLLFIGLGLYTAWSGVRALR